MKRKQLGKYIVADPQIGHGQPAFRGTRVTVRQVLEMVAGGKDWATISEQWDGAISKEAIVEALLVATQALVKYEHRRPSWLDDEDCDWLNDKSPVWPEAKTLGQYIVANPKICHGQITFRGTRIFVEDALKMVAEGEDWDHINWQWHGKVGKEAIAEAIRVATRALEEHESARITASAQALEMIG